ncbi:IclR family transcriptional regulator [Brevibacterium litoralis]|uniref:IclR family transcriptional regulator n=1 Tax=Brevibacterium litoralis TaxID=3138935 RepID=UPI0032EE3459
MPEAGTSRGGGLGTIRNAVRLLDLLATGPAWHALTDLATRSEMSVPTVHRLLRSLVLAGYAVQDPATSRYGLGPQFTRLSSHYLSRHPVLAALAPFAVPLRDQVAATVSVYELVGAEVVCIDQVDAGDRGAFRAASPRAHNPLLSAPGRLLLARACKEDWEAARTALATEDPALAEEVAGYRTEWAGADSVRVDAPDALRSAQVAVPVQASDGRAVAALAADLPAGVTDDRVTAIAGAMHRTALTVKGGLHV